MTTSERFAITLHERPAGDGGPPPEDPLGELSAESMALRRFCFEQNRRVAIVAGSQRFDVYLFPDVMLILDELPGLVHHLARGVSAILDFPESHRLARFTPMGGQMLCSVESYGYAVARIEVPLETVQVLDTLRGFLSELMRCAVAGGYMTREQGDAFVAAAI